MKITILYKGSEEIGEIIKESETHYFVELDSDVRVKVAKDSKSILKIHKKVKEKVVKETTEDKIERLEKEIRKAKKAYYNDEPLMSDEEFDKLEDELRELDPKNAVLKEVGAKVEKNKVSLPYYMPSLDKLKPDTAEKWLKNNPGPYVISDKIDGISVEIVGKNNKWNLYTRGDGSIGQDITGLSKYLKLPKAPSKEVAIRAELVMSIANFENLNVKAANARNFVGGLTNSTKNLNTDHIKKVDVMAYELINIPMKPSEQFETLGKLGFQTANWRSVKNLDSETLVSFLATRKKKTSLEMDGLVVTLDKVNKRTTSGNPKYSVAFKTLTDDQTAIVKVVEVHWEPSKHGYLKPTVEVETVLLKGTEVSFCTGFNAKFIMDNNIGPGSVLKICRSGDVIPHILEVIKSSKEPQMPEDFEYSWTNSGVDIVLNDALENDVVQKKQITEFFRTLEVDNLSYGIISNLYENGYDTVFKILKMSEKDIANIKGLGPVIAKKIKNNINKSLTVTLPVLMRASSCFDRNLGLTRLEQVVEEFPDILEMNEKTIAKQLLNLNGFSEIISKSFVKGLPNFKQFFKKALSCGIEIKGKEKVVVTSQKLKNMNILFTGFREKDLEHVIEKNGGKIANSMSSKVSVLLVKDKGSGSSKATKARELNIPIMTSDEFRKKYNF